MHAERTRPGGRHMLDERGGYKAQGWAKDGAGATCWPSEVEEWPIATAPLWTFLSAQSLSALSQCYPFARAA